MSNSYKQQVRLQHMVLVYQKTQIMLATQDTESVLKQLPKQYKIMWRFLLLYTISVLSTYTET